MLDKWMVQFLRKCRHVGILLGLTLPGVLLSGVSLSGLLLAGVLLAGMLHANVGMAGQNMQTPLEKADYARISQSAEMSAYLKELAAASTDATLEVQGQSVQGRPIEALAFIRAKSAEVSATRRPRIMIIGSQHGAAEPAGGEAMLVIARDLVSGDLHSMLDSMDVILIPNANPDGRDLLHRSNANTININTDFVLMSQPESQVLAHAVRQYQPDVLLDSHESAILKRQTLAKDGYLTDFYAQFESANHPAVPAGAREFAFGTLLPDMLARASAQGLPAHRYIGEITSIHQPITHGGLTIQNFRNMAGMNGALSFLVETKLDSRDDTFPTYRNIGERVGRQLICLRAFLDVAYARQKEILAQVDRMRAAMTTEAVTLKARYVKDPQHPEVAIALRKLDTRELKTLIFRDHRKMETADVMPLPAWLAITEHLDKMIPFLEKHKVVFERLSSPAKAEVFANRYKTSGVFAVGASAIASTEKPMTLAAGAVLVDLSQPLGRMAMLLLDPRSNSNVFRYPEYASLLKDNQEFFIYPMLQAPVRE